jgi:hypothetical protein
MAFTFGVDFGVWSGRYAVRLGIFVQWHIVDLGRDQLLHRESRLTSH